MTSYLEIVAGIDFRRSDVPQNKLVARNHFYNRVVAVQLSDIYVEIEEAKVILVLPATPRVEVGNDIRAAVAANVELVRARSTSHHVISDFNLEDVVATATFDIVIARESPEMVWIAGADDPVVTPKRGLHEIEAERIVVASKVACLGGLNPRDGGEDRPVVIPEGHCGYLAALQSSPGICEVFAFDTDQTGAEIGLVIFCEGSGMALKLQSLWIEVVDVLANGRIFCELHRGHIQALHELRSSIEKRLYHSTEIDDRRAA
jgi:hypothetical protein